MPTPSSEVIVIGGGTNGLACAARLAQAGRKVTVLEAGAVAGGGAATVEFAPGYRVSGLAHLLNLLDTRVIEGMNLSPHGLAYAATDLSTTALSTSGSIWSGRPFAARLSGSVSPRTRKLGTSFARD